MPITFKKDKKCKKIKEGKKIEGKRVRLVSLVMQISLASGEKNTFVVRAVTIT